MPPKSWLSGVSCVLPICQYDALESTWAFACTVAAVRCEPARSEQRHTRQVAPLNVNPFTNVAVDSHQRQTAAATASAAQQESTDSPSRTTTQKHPFAGTTPTPQTNTERKQDDHMHQRSRSRKLYSQLPPSSMRPESEVLPLRRPAAGSWTQTSEQVAQNNYSDDKSSPFGLRCPSCLRAGPGGMPGRA